MAREMSSNELQMAAFCHWMLTMSAGEAAFISQQVKSFRENKERVAAFTVLYYQGRGKR